MRILKYIFLIVMGSFSIYLVYRLFITDGFTRNDYLIMLVLNLAGVFASIRYYYFRPKE